MGIKVCSVCVDNQTSLRSISLLSHPNHRDTVTQFVGIHPSFAKHEDVVKFCSMLESNIQSIDGIGEIGLDRTYTLDNYSPYPKQLEVFELMLRLAERHHRPISVHSRKSLDDIVQLMSTFRIPGVLLHWFSGSKRQLERCLDRGYYISYGPALLYSQDKEVLLKKLIRTKYWLRLTVRIDILIVLVTFPLCQAHFWQALQSQQAGFWGCRMKKHFKWLPQIGAIL